jgi:hypothetical protein
MKKENAKAKKINLIEKADIRTTRESIKHMR